LQLLPDCNSFRRVKTIILCWLGLLCGGFAEPLRVSALHPLLADLARQVGGGRVEVYDLVGEGGNPHRFEPRPADMKKMQSSGLVLAAGKHLEQYLDRLEANLGGVTILEVGRTIPSLTADKDAVDACCPSHGANALDPHWWHGVDNTRRAARVLAQAFAEKDPSGKDTYLANAGAYGQRLDGLKKWAKAELAKVPRGQRKLVTAHNGFAYFAREFGFEVIAVAGLNKEQNTAPREQAKAIDSVRKSGVRAVFPEKGDDTKSLQTVATATGARIGEPLIADGNGSGGDAGFEGMIRHNVSAITKALAAP
jgi:zinc/manganese transport system substrate-binding protein